jgi:O-antigen/teichoic acid export membrane protein
MIHKLKLSRYYNKHSLVLFGNGAQQLVGLVTGFVLFHYLSPAETGMWFLIMSFVGLLEAGRYGFLATATVTFYAGTDAQRGATVMGSVWFLALSITVFVLAVNAGGLLLLPLTTNRELILCIKWIGITFASSLVTDVIFWRLQAEEKYGKTFVLKLLNSISTIIVFIVLIVLHQFTLETALLFNFLTNCLAVLTGILWNLSGFKNIVHRSQECILEITHFGKFTFGTTLFSSLLGNSDTWILNFILGPAAVAVYNLATKFIGLADLPLRSFITIAMSEMAIAFNAKNMERVTYIFKKYAGMMTVAFVPAAIAVYFVAGLLTRAYGGHNFDGAMAADAANTYRIMMVLAIAYPLDRFNGLALDIVHKTKANFHKMILMLATRIVAGFIFTSILRNIYGIVIANYLMTILGILYGYSQLRTSIDYTIPGLLVTGYSEISLFLKKELKIIFGAKDTP